MTPATRSKIALLGTLAVLLLVVPLLFPSAFHLRVAALVWINAIAALGLALLMGLAGQVSLGHAGFLAIGAYATALGPRHLGLDPLLSMLAGVFAAGILAFLVGRPILRLKGHYLAVATLGLGILVHLVVVSEVAITGGPDGIQVPRLVLFGWRVVGPEIWYAITGVVLLLATWIALNLEDSSTGRALRALHDSEIAAAVAGIDVARHKLLVFVVAAVYAALAGGLLALLNRFVTPDVASFLRSIELVTMVVIGGMGSIAGAIVGAALLTVLPQLLTFFHDYEHAVLGLAIVLFMVFLRQGIVPGLAGLFARGRRA
ncbi:MAG: branched-chain amino acid ABC transporter permease [Geminicoccaceae bacterium]|nr:branched-chain amino acid ABC transporter permease [Geminicoccaceae bacterium]MCS7268850.1 branched-chain amino acid ABC transporter permease [Geminicoccaceae bacterium]MCX7631435.1 branched-chain amino acid ABC transporter permease [Geminicoccaceae bacterium]MDW8125227.1 branched-chain amino acid ABC transporter permease [Geminicoccaceae bacterium]MDW8341020.1 branched-chain amino acid ABC transporter permease [Geminicoccaceae bacterium]